MELEFTLDKADLLEYAHYARKAQSRIIQQRMKGLITTWVAVCVVIILAGTFLNAGGFFNVGRVLGILVMFVAVLLSLLIFVKMYLKRFLDIFYSPEFFPDLFASQKILLNTDMLVSIRMNSRAEFLWSGITEIAHGERHTFILLANKTGFVVPHRIFRNSTEIQGFKDVLEPLWNNGKNKTTTFNASAK